MRRLAAAAGTAAALHGLLLLSGGAWLSTGKPAGVRRPRPVTVRLLEPRREPAPEASPAPKEKASPQEHTSIQAKRPGVVFSSPPSPARSQRRGAACRSPVPPRVLSPGSTPASVPHIPERAPEAAASAVRGPAPGSTSAAAPSEPRSLPARTSPLPGVSGGSDVEAPAPPVEEAEPLYRENPPPDYPRVARRRGYEGTVLLEVLVTEEGRVGELRVAESSGHDLLDKAALRGVEEWRFRPGRRGDRAVARRVIIPVRFRLK